MREELMKEALCWELEAKVTAEYAYTDRDLLYFCPIEGCLEPVHPEQRKNVYFKARNRHKEGCPNEAPSSEPSLTPGEPKPRPPAEPATPVPTHLGPGLPLKRKGKRPTPADLLTLARTLTTSQPCHPGTFEEVVRAWIAMSSAERKASRLNIQGIETTYQDAFHFLTRGMDDINKLPCQSGIVFGGARIVDLKDKDYYLVDSIKKFNNGDNKLPIRLVVKKRHAFPINIPGLLGKDCTLFWHGSIPSLEPVKSNSYRVKADPLQAYQGIVVLEGNFFP